ncbi:hypothetical protein CYK21_04315 [Streptococcus macedonicus]|uniref:Uncharacterized protein n=3 Tax=Streptococcus TaxID=1301 RepID=A0A3L8GC73_STRIN|nr:hypothetical protein B1H24_03860 [Streptococcus agalactiae]AUW23635.1 hypothetical protein CR541_03610 [Streptococcus suis]MBC8694276.1 hypothetical protein [Staphylococcus pseudintermedius]PLA54454.1 hypothetical protein CYK21_04315 [Streptococcus macedonicus]RGB99408.1 hypothetical protein DWV89_08145 [Streptococcus pasteurianus]RLU51131.1 hypothetical protein DIY09_10780 [Streptococcus iniae]TNW91884.1 hypothetical protein FIU59_09750 [Enterococcus faecium]
MNLLKFLKRQVDFLTNCPITFCHDDTLLLTFPSSGLAPIPYLIRGLPKSLKSSLFGFCELRYCVHNIPKILSPADQNL